jgi:hypothetical protein
MGQQQLLLIVLGVIIVGIAIVVGINLFNANAEESAIDTVVSEGTNIAALAQQYYKKPVALGGGGNAFDNSGGGTGFEIPDRLVTSQIGGIDWVPTPGAQAMVFTFTNDNTTGYDFVSVEVTVDNQSIESVVNR